MFCTNCGEENDDESKFCKNCGSLLDQLLEDNVSEEELNDSIEYSETDEVNEINNNGKRRRRPRKHNKRYDEGKISKNPKNSSGGFDKLLGRAVIGGDTSYIEEYLSEYEEIIQSFHFMRDAIILTNFGIYIMDVRGLTGKRVEVKFFPKQTIKTISFETAGTLDFDVDINIGVMNNIVSGRGGYAQAPLSFKVPRSQTEEAKTIIKLVKETYLI